MNECLITKLRSVVNDNSLEKLGEFKFNVVTNGKAVTSVNISKVLGDGDYITIKNSSGKVLTTWTRANAQEDNFYQYQFPSDVADTYSVSVSDKYLLGSLYAVGVNGIERVEMDIDGLRYTKADTTFSTNSFAFNFKGIKGNLSSLSFLKESKQTNILLNRSEIVGTLKEFASIFVNYVEINISSSALVGQLVDLATLTKATKMEFSTKGVSSKVGLKAFLDKLYANGKRGTLSLVLGTDYNGNDAGITKYNPIITFTESGWSWE